MSRGSNGRSVRVMKSISLLASFALALAGCGHGGNDCGACPANASCGASNGISVCKAASGVPQLKHAFLIMMENTSLSTLQASSKAPYINGLFAAAATGADYHGDAHPSLPNYLAITSGGTQGVSCDCNPSGDACTSLNCSALSGNCGCTNPAMNLGDVLEAAGKSWKAYAEDMGAPCVLTSSGEYATRHVPFLYYSDINTDGARCAAHVVDYAAGFPADLAGDTPDFVYIAPNLIHDMHDPFPATDTNLANGDMWLSQVVPQIQATAAYKDGGAIFIVWDEDDLSGLVDADAPIPILILSPYAKAGYVSHTHANHYSLLATLADAFGATRLGASADALPLAEYFAAQ